VGYPERDIIDLTRSVIVKKAMDEVKEYADYQSYTRRHPERYEHVQSKVARNLVVQKSANRRTRKDRGSQERGSSGYKWTYEEFA